LIEQGEADLAVGHFPDLIAALVSQGDDASLRHARLYDTRYVCVMRRGHPLARKRLTLDALLRGPPPVSQFSGRPQGWSIVRSPTSVGSAASC
jgi:DNA-binding transcriptional LysR family regulator